MTITPVRPHATELHPHWCMSAVGCGGLHRSGLSEVFGIALDGGTPVALLSAVLAEDGQRSVEIELGDDIRASNGRIQLTAASADQMIAALVRYRDLIATHPRMEARDVDAWLAAQAAEFLPEPAVVA